MQNTSSTFHVGIDVSGKFLDIAVLETAETFRVDNQPHAIDELVARMLTLDPALIVMEATGKLELAVLSAMLMAGLPAVAVNPRNVRAFAHATGQRAKTDRIDSLLIARYAQAVKPPVRPLTDGHTQQLQALLLRRLQLLEMLNAEVARLRRAHPATRPSLRENIKWLSQQVHIADLDIGAFVRACPAWQDKEALLRSVPGVGPTISATLLAFLPELGSLDNREIASLAGLAPFNCDSGARKGKRRIAGGRIAVRRVLYMACISGQRWNATIKALNTRLLAAGKPFKVAITACMRRLLVMLNAMVRDSAPWNPIAA
ncbi:IS110 family transposase [Paraburkholderia sp.]|uniref:IS110 family transposase n=1 Tax=Paraburkholderia sp. TaxID=1926495 RepID=UPI00238FF4CC|nr:IS110 family transposase [Paraburkholderia sp.]MDE1180135.1 IS110 family transposase [Paraburkholderia sp.]MDE1181121.1 IS110 family transposase [Paraburkholderia sp.]